MVGAGRKLQAKGIEVAKSRGIERLGGADQRFKPEDERLGGEYGVWI